MKKTYSLYSSTPFIAVLIFLAAGGKKSCNESKSLQEMDTCGSPLTLIDARGMDGCTYLFETEEQQKLLASNINPGSLGLEDKASLRGDWSQEEGGMSICMQEDKIVKLNCLAKPSNMANANADCGNIVDPYKLEWSAKWMTQNSPSKVELWVDKDIQVLVYHTRSGVYAYTCDGHFLCFQAPGSGSPCLEALQGLKDRKTLYVVDNQLPVK